MVGQEKARGTREFDHRDPDPAVLDGEDHPAAQGRGQVGDIRGDVAARRVQEVEALEQRRRLHAAVRLDRNAMAAASVATRRGEAGPGSAAKVPAHHRLIADGQVPVAPAEAPRATRVREAPGPEFRGDLERPARRRRRRARSSAG